MKKHLVMLASVLLFGMTALAEGEEKGLFAGRYSHIQVFNCQRNPKMPVEGQDFTVSQFEIFYNSDWGSGYYDAYIKDAILYFVLSGDADNPFSLRMDRIANGVKKEETVAAKGNIYGLGEEGFLFVQSPNNYGYFISNLKACPYKKEVPDFSITYKPDITGPITIAQAEAYAANTVPQTSLHTHVWATEWSHDDTAHWHECTAADCTLADNTQKDGYAVHTEVTAAVAATCTTDGLTAGWSCTVCGGSKTQTVVSALGHAYTYAADGTDTIKETCPNGCLHVATAKIVPPSELVYDGSAKEATVALTDNWLGGTLTPSYSTDGNVNAGTVEATITKDGVDAKVTYEIFPRAIDDIGISVDEISNQLYTGSAIMPPVTVKDGAKTLVEGTDYEVSYANNTNAGTATVTIMGKENYFDSRTVQFTIITAKPFKNPFEGLDSTNSPSTEQLESVNYTAEYNGQPHQIDVLSKLAQTVQDQNPTITYATTETGTYSDTPITRTDAGTTTVWYKISISQYEDFVNSATLTIAKRDINKVAVSTIESQIYTGNSIEPAFTVTDGEPSIIKASDYTVAYANNTEPGTATITLTATTTGNYTSTKTVEFEILPNVEAKIKWRFNFGTGTYFAQVKVLKNGSAALNDLAFIFADRMQNNEVYAQLWDTKNSAAVGATTTLQGVTETVRCVELDPTLLSNGVETVYGVSDATMAETTSVPNAERLIELFVGKRISPVSGNMASDGVEYFLGYLRYTIGGKVYYIPLLEEAPKGTKMVASAQPVSLQTLNLASAFNMPAVASLEPTCEIDTFTVGTDEITGTFTVTASAAGETTTVETLGKNVTVKLFGTTALDQPFVELTQAEVSVEEKSFKLAKPEGYQFFRVKLEIGSVVE